MHTPMDKSWGSMCSLVYQDFKNSYFISVLKLICKLQMFVYIAVTKEFTMRNSPFFWISLTHFGEKNYTLVDAKIHENTISKESTSYTSTFKNYDG